ncbi:MAG: FtsX-like permease family protein [Zoogloeaceae bacterium]|jgi:putative ABC transport system permease protein|nr:FtsX-like permease family protein [Zoogloeaceae bacterium]
MSGGLFSMAWRNLWRNRRRSFATIASIAFGLAAVSTVAGYMQAVNNGLGNIAVHSDLIGHLTIYKKGWQTEGKLHPARYLLTEEEIDRIRAIVAATTPGARLAARLSVMGLVSNGRQSTIFIAEGVAPEDMSLLRGPFGASDEVLREDSPQGVIVASGLAEILGLKTNDAASILVSTVHGQANAADIDIDAIVNTGNLATNDKWIAMPLELARDQMDAKGRAEALTLLLPVHGTGQPLSGKAADLAMYDRFPPDDAAMSALRQRLAAAFAEAGIETDMLTWQEMSPFYTQVRSMWDMMYGLFLGVVLAIVVLSVANSVGMTVVERTREIGALRAIGMRRGGVARLFVTETALLVLLGIATGFVLALLTRAGINALDIRWVPPSLSKDVQFYVGFDPLRTVLAALALAALAIAAAFMPARRAARHPIIVSLGHV